MSTCATPDEELCGCCTGVTNETPELVTNRPALPAIAYRVGRYATFDASMLANLSATGGLSSPVAPLALLRTRDPSDFSIALLDSWAIVLDILTFYQERFANEAFLRTAVDQRSVFELARLIGYVPSPGVSASAVLAFTLSDAPGSPLAVPIPAGTRVQSVPGPGQSPQVFETAADLNALVAWNALPARTSIAWQLAPSDTSTSITGTANGINPGDALLFVAANGGQPSATGPGGVRYVVDVATDPAAGTTRITWNSSLAATFADPMDSTQVCVYAFRKKAALYGAQAPNPTLLPQSTPPAPGLNGAKTDWNYNQYEKGSGTINLDASYPGLVPAASGPPEWAVLTGEGYTSFFQVNDASESNPNLYTLTAKTTQLTLAPGQILTGDTALSLDGVLANFTRETRDITVYVQSVLLSPADLPMTAPSWQSHAMQAGMLMPVGGNAISIVGGQQIASGQPLGVSGRRVRVQVLPGARATFAPAQSSASSAVTDNQQFLVNAWPPASAAGGASGASAWNVQTASGISGTLVVPDSRALLLPSDSKDPPVGEVAVASSVDPSGDITRLGLAASLGGLYDAASVTVNANAVNATHGETQQEILGSGDATNPALQVSLKQAPLTYVPAPVGNGAQSTLQVWVNNLRWREVANLLSSGASDRVFVTALDRNGKAVLTFGNGVEGARPPTGQMNIRAVYRKGIGSAGMLDAGQLSQALDRPQGLKSVVNPSATGGGADPATAADARARAPLPTLTIGRVVSLEDYQNFALDFNGVSKASASWAHFSGTRGVFLSIAGANGATVQPTDSLVTGLIQALRSAGDPNVPLRVVSYQPVLFEVVASIDIDQDNYLPAQVLDQAWQNLSAAFSFSQRMLGQNLATSEIVQVIQRTPGVIALRVQGVFPSGSPSDSVPAQLCASAASPPNGAQMLLIDPASQGNLGVWS
jgi:Baseplate J-like protein